MSTLSEGATEAFAETKRLMRSAQEQGLASQMNAEAASIARLVASPNGREGIEAFFAKRKPVFQ
ncbi:enoyl-CoA hydratase [compost metagenome]